MDAKTTFRKMITDCLVDLGWTRNDGPALASKTYDTAVGKKEALAWLNYYDGEGDEAVLAGEYWSQGNNFLEASGVFILKTVDLAQIQAKVKEFASNADAKIDDSYARRLYLLDVMPRGAPPAGGMTLTWCPHAKAVSSPRRGREQSECAPE